MNKTITLFLSFCIFILGLIIPNTNIKAQVADGTNFDFSLGDFTNWKGYQSKNNSSSTTIDFYNWILYPNPDTCFHQNLPCFVINSDTSEYDPNIGSLLKVPYHLGYNKSVKINVDESGANANYLSYDMLITNENCMVTFNFALILETPGHQGYQNPFAKIEVLEIDANKSKADILHPSFTYLVLGSQPPPIGWTNFTTAGAQGIWQNWRQVTMDLSNYIGHSIRLNILITGCSPTAHYAYGYFTGEVAPKIIEVNSCLDNLSDTTNSYGLYIDIDGFKKINDIYGHDRGDQFLIDIANHFINNWEHNVIYYRLGGDEFFIYVYDHTEREVIIRANQIIKDVETLNPKLRDLKISASVGIVPINDITRQYHVLLNLGDHTMYSSKNKGKGYVTLYNGI